MHTIDLHFFWSLQCVRRPNRDLWIQIVSPAKYWIDEKPESVTSSNQIELDW